MGRNRFNAITSFHISRNSKSTPAARISRKSRIGRTFWKRRVDLGGLFVRYREKVNVKRNVVAGAKRVFAVGENLDAGKETREQGAEARAGEKILMVSLQQVPGNYPPIIKIRN